MSALPFGAWPPGMVATSVTFAAVQAALAAATGPVSFNGQRLTDVGDGVDPTDGVNLGQVTTVLAGFVVGPVVATDNAAARFDGTTGKLVQDGVVTISDTGAVAAAISYNGAPLNGDATRVALGVGAGNFATATGVNTTAIGAGAGASLTTGAGNTALGHGTLAACTTAIDNVAIGNNAMAISTSATGCVAIGADCMPLLTTGSSNVAIGNGAHGSAVSASFGVAIGAFALFSLQGGGNLNVAIGSSAMSFLTAGGQNIGIGGSAMRHAVSAVNNIAIGQTAGDGMAAGPSNNNIFIGALCGTGAGVNGHSNNVIIGPSAGNNVASDNNIIIGQSATSPDVAVNGQISIGDIYWGSTLASVARIGGSGSLSAQVGKLRVEQPGADSVPVLELASTGANGASIRVSAGTRNPNGAVSGNAGDLYVRKNGATSGVYVNQSAADPGTTWVLLL